MNEQPKDHIDRRQPVHYRRAGEEIKTNWHLSKLVSGSVIISIISLGSLVVWKTATHDKAILDNEKASHLAIFNLNKDFDEKFIRIAEIVREGTKDRIHGATVDLMFQIRDNQIQVLSDTLIKIGQEMETTNSVLRSAIIIGDKNTDARLRDTEKKQ